MRIITANELQKRVAKIASKMDCENIKLAKQGKGNKVVDDKIFELMFIHTFLPYWSTDQIKQKECYINSKFGS